MASTQKYPGNNLTALLLGTAEFSFSADATSATDANGKGYVSFGNIVAFTPSVEPTIVEHFGSYQGIKTKDKTVVTQTKLEYQLRCDEWNRETLKTLFAATQGTNHTQASKSDGNADTIAFSAQAPSTPDRWYDILFSGAHYYHATTVTVATLTEGTDFEVDLVNGRIRFITTQTASRVPVVTGPAILATDATSYMKLTPFGDAVKTGYGRLIVYDQDSTNEVVLRHTDFSCEVRVESASELSGNDFTDMTLVVSVTSTMGTVEVRQDNDMAGV